MSKKLRLYSIKHTLTGLRLGLRNTCYMMRVGFSGFLSEFAGSVITLAGNLAFGKYTGDVGIAAFGVVCYLTPIVFNVYYAVSSSVQPIISFNYGAQFKERVRRAFLLSLKVNMCFAIVVTLLLDVGATPVVSVFLDHHSPSFAMAAHGLVLYSISFVLAGFNLSTIGYFQSTENNAIASLLVSLRGIFLLILAFWWLPIFWGETGLWLAVPAAEAFTAIVALVLLRLNQKHYATA